MKNSTINSLVFMSMVSFLPVIAYSEQDSKPPNQETVQTNSPAEANGTHPEEPSRDRVLQQDAEQDTACEQEKNKIIQATQTLEPELSQKIQELHQQCIVHLAQKNVEILKKNERLTQKVEKLEYTNKDLEGLAQLYKSYWRIADQRLQNIIQQVALLVRNNNELSTTAYHYKIIAYIMSLTTVSFMTYVCWDRIEYMFSKIYKRIIACVHLTRREAHRKKIEEDLLVDQEQSVE